MKTYYKGVGKSVTFFGLESVNLYLSLIPIVILITYIFSIVKEPKLTGTMIVMLVGIAFINIFWILFITDYQKKHGLGGIKRLIASKKFQIKNPVCYGKENAQ